MSRLKSLNISMVFIVFWIMISSGLLTFASFIFLSFVGLFSIFALTPAFSPMITLIVSCIIGTSISAATSKRILKPLNQLIKATKIVSSGDFSVRVDEKSSNYEISELLKNFNQMAEELGSIEMFRNNFINDFSHEFKTPIVSIRGFAKQLQNENLSAEKRREYADIIVSESERLANMSANVLLLSKFENQKVITNQTEYYLDEQIRNCIILFEKQWDNKHLEINIDLEPIKIYNNAEMLSHLWINLIENAIKYSDENGCIYISCRENNNKIEFIISDTGRGMDENTVKHIFDKFYQGDKSHATQGNGIGLSIVKRIIELCKGEITVDSSLGQGTTFFVKLPKIHG
ncbi:HAMP domain-containing histidine kinase [Ruminiclostridium herbifermentans]|uniref:Heme sensor protein HssS n=1 Tax=Ruminiclostridium herbifermentans TaxID=2488810 RepID=A0A4U7JBH9_9FIRM|nr:HAMP domain-containing sensor histidine kinase [Ruminiclostridium herbifermentans]QNU66848.1 HAMP domain-containing histidine kinase [Ruminiclostridium herbifermentans]